MLFFILILMTALAGCGGTREDARPAPVKAAPPKTAAPAPAADDRPVIVAFGDSLTAGFGVDPGQSYPDFLQRDLDKRGYRFRVVNAGVSGDTTTDGLARVASVLAFHPKIVILEFGGNDGLRGLPVATTRDNLARMIEGLRKGGAEVVLAGMTLPPNYGPDYIREFEGVFSGLREQYHLRMIPFLLAGVAGTKLMQRDGLHATATGNAVVASNVLRALEPLLKDRPRTAE